MSTLWTGARQGNATLAAKLAAFDYLDAAPRTLQGPAPPRFFLTIGAYLAWKEAFAPLLRLSRQFDDMDLARTGSEAASSIVGDVIAGAMSPSSWGTIDASGAKWTAVVAMSLNARAQ
jgi:hypothetical protein